jgi:hypothetical protein
VIALRFVGGEYAEKIKSLFPVEVIKIFKTGSEACSTACRIALLGHKNFAVLAEQMGVRTQTQYKQEYLGTLFTADTLYGVAELRDGAAVALAVPA